MLIAIMKVKAESGNVHSTGKNSSSTIWRLATDMDWQIRKIAAVEIKSFFSTSNPQSPSSEESKIEEEAPSKFQSTLVEVFEELLKDEEGFVKSEAIRSFSVVINCGIS